MEDLAISGNSIHPEQTEIIMYQTEDGLTKIDVRMENETVWLTQAQMAELFQRERSGITKHIKNVFAEGFRSIVILKPRYVPSSIGSPVAVHFAIATAICSPAFSLLSYLTPPIVISNSLFNA